MNNRAKINMGVAIAISLIALVLIGIGVAKQGPNKACNDRIDNDNDGLTDYPNDPGCSSRTDTTETSSSLVCDNGIDETNDADSLADYRLSSGDPGCTSATDNSEIDGTCDDKLDNDGDSHIDYNPSLGIGDSKCTSFSDNDESPKDSCADSDNFNFENIGIVAGYDEDASYNHSDYCETSTTLKEYYCGTKNQDYAPLTYAYSCTGNYTGCVNGACV